MTSVSKRNLDLHVRTPELQPVHEQPEPGGDRRVLAEEDFDREAQLAHVAVVVVVLGGLEREILGVVDDIDVQTRPEEDALAQAPGHPPEDHRLTPYDLAIEQWLARPAISFIEVN